MNIKAIIMTALELAVWIIPLVAAAAIFFRSGDSYRDSYDHSSLRGMGISFARYKNMFRILGAFLAVLGCGVFYWLYLWEPENPGAELSEFWNSIEKEKNKDLIFPTAEF